MNANPETPTPDGEREPKVESRDGANNADRERGLSTPPDPASGMVAALTWVEENQSLAMLGAFALGIFIGTMMRD